MASQWYSSFNRGQKGKPGDGQIRSANKNRGWETLEEMKSDPNVRVIETPNIEMYAGMYPRPAEALPLVQDLVHNISLEDDGITGVYRFTATKPRENIKVLIEFDTAVNSQHDQPNCGDVWGPAHAHDELALLGHLSGGTHDHSAQVPCH
jgi:hypothetical protein